MKVALVGSGNVATVLGRLIIRNKHEVIQVISRDTKNAKKLALELDASFCDFDGKPNIDAELFIIAIADQALENFFTRHGLGNRTVVHTAGSSPMDVLKKLSTHYGVLYPLQSLRKEMDNIPPIPFLVDGSSEPTLKFIEEFARTISPSVMRTNDEERLKLHAAAVVVSNFTNHLYSIAEDFCKKEKVSFDLLIPLILETANRLKFSSPSQVQTGPAVRKDIITMDKHLRLFTAHPKLRTTYLRLTDSIMNP